VHLGYGRVQLKCDGTQGHTGGEVQACIDACGHAIKLLNIQCVRKVTVHLGYGRVQLKCDGTQ